MQRAKLLISKSSSMYGINSVSGLRHYILHRQKENQRVPQCTLEKEEAIMDALRHFKMV